MEGISMKTIKIKFKENLFPETTNEWLASIGALAWIFVVYVAPIFMPFAVIAWIQLGLNDFNIIVEDSK